MRSSSKTAGLSLVAVFAHPDDEAFGPAATIARYAREGDVYLICVTGGQAGDDRQLGRIRVEELKASAKILGVKKVYNLGFLDGTLSNNLYHRLAAKIEEKVKLLKPRTLLTFEPRGISGHIDHIVVSLVTTYVFYRVSTAKTLLYHCISQESRKMISDYFIYFPPGYKKKEIDLVVDITADFGKKLAAIAAHKTQSGDTKRFISILKRLPKEEYFLKITKE